MTSKASRAASNVTGSLEGRTVRTTTRNPRLAARAVGPERVVDVGCRAPWRKSPPRPVDRRAPGAPGRRPIRLKAGASGCVARRGFVFTCPRIYDKRRPAAPRPQQIRHSPLPPLTVVPCGGPTRGRGQSGGHRRRPLPARDITWEGPRAHHQDSRSSSSPSPRSPPASPPPRPTAGEPSVPAAQAAAAPRQAARASARAWHARGPRAADLAAARARSSPPATTAGAVHRPGERGVRRRTVAVRPGTVAAGASSPTAPSPPDEVAAAADARRHGRGKLARRCDRQGPAPRSGGSAPCGRIGRVEPPRASGSRSSRSPAGGTASAAAGLHRMMMLESGGRRQDGRQRCTRASSSTTPRTWTGSWNPWRRHSVYDGWAADPRHRLRPQSGAWARAGGPTRIPMAF